MVINQQRLISQTERFRTQNAFDVWKRIHLFGLKIVHL